MQELPGEWRKNALHSYCPENRALIVTVSASKAWREREEQHMCMGSRASRRYLWFLIQSQSGLRCNSLDRLQGV